MSRRSVIPQVVGRLMRNLAAGRWVADETLLPTRELAAELGVARKTLLAALHEAELQQLLAIRPRQGIRVLPGAAQRSADRLAYLASRRTHRRLAIVVPEKHASLRDRFYSAIVQGIVSEAARHDLDAELVPLPFRQQHCADVVLSDRGFGAALCLAFNPAYLPTLMLLQERRFPVMTFNRRLPGVNVPSVCVDDYGLARRLVALLADLGHRDLCLVCSIVAVSDHSGTATVAGWIDALRERSLLQGCSMPLHTTPPVKGLPAFPRSFEAVMSLPHRPTALVFNDTLSGESFLTDPRFRSLRVPEDLSVVVINPGPRGLAVPGRPLLAAARIDERRTVQCCLEMAERLFSGDLHPASLRLPADITLTDSVGPAPAGRGV